MKENVSGCFFSEHSVHLGFEILSLRALRLEREWKTFTYHTTMLTR